MAGKQPARPVIQFTTPAEGVRVRCDCGGDTFYLAVHVKLSGALVTRTAECAGCGHRESIDRQSFPGRAPESNERVR